MNIIKEYVHAIFDMFTRIIVWTLFATACYIRIFWGEDAQLTVAVLWQMMGVSLVCAVGSVLLFRNIEHTTKRGMLLRYVLSYLYINAVILFAGFYCKWFQLSDWKMVLGMIVLIALGYVVITLISYRAAKWEATQMNEKLREREN